MPSVDPELNPLPAACDSSRKSADSLSAFFGVMSLFAAGLALGGLAGRLDHAFASVAMILPVVGVSAYLYRPRVAGVVAIGGMAAWAVAREMLTAEPAWSILFTFTMSLLILFGTGWLVESLFNAREAARHFAQTEPLTRLFNRNAFLGHLQLEIDRSRRQGHPLAMAFLDCDHFKSWNDTQGHLAGDDVLKQIAATLTAGTRAYDIVARLGGDEFAVLFPELEPSLAEATAGRLHEKLQADFRRREFSVTVSLGLVAFEAPPADARDVITAADQLMYNAKRLGRDQVVTRCESVRRTVSSEAEAPLAVDGMFEEPCAAT